MCYTYTVYLLPVSQLNYFQTNSEDPHPLCHWSIGTVRKGETEKYQKLNQQIASNPFNLTDIHFVNIPPQDFIEIQFFLLCKLTYKCNSLINLDIQLLIHLFIFLNKLILEEQ